MVEILIIAVLVLWSCIVVFKKLMPNTANRLLSVISDRCQQKGWHRLSVWLKPQKNMGCGGNCGCDSKDEQAQITEEIKAVKWK